jgi:hypothetical protein
MGEACMKKRSTKLYYIGRFKVAPMKRYQYFITEGIDSIPASAKDLLSIRARNRREAMRIFRDEGGLAYFGLR